jgi:hypothetical protein
MKKKTRITTAAKTPLDTLRKTSSYPGARVMFGLPFLVFGCLYLLTGGWLVITSVADAFGGDTGAATAFLSLAAGALCFIAGLFFIGVTFLADAIFDIADCAVRGDSRAAALEAREAYETFKRTGTHG